MAHFLLGPAGARKQPYVHAGEAEEIRAALRLHGLLSRYKLYLSTGIEPERLQPIVNAMVARGQLAHMQGAKARLVGLPEQIAAAKQAAKVRRSKPEPLGPFAIAGRIEHGKGARWFL